MALSGTKGTWNIAGGLPVFLPAADSRYRLALRCKQAQPRSLRTALVLAALLAGWAFALPGGVFPTENTAKSRTHSGQQEFTSAELEPLIDHLERFGFDRGRIEKVFYDQRLRKMDRVIAFNAMNPDSERIYSQFTTSYAIHIARKFRRRHFTELKEIERVYGVPNEIVTAILLVETRFGGVKLPYRVLEVFTTLAVEAHPEAVERHFQLLKVRHPEIEKEWLAGRLMKKADFALTELVAVLSMYQENPDRLYHLRGSYAGAMGIPQFLPSSYLSWAVDGNGDERVDLDNLSDAMASVGNYLRSHGWTPEASLREKWRAVWEYNHSDNYVRTMFEIAFRLSTPRKRKRRRVAMVVESTAVESASVESTTVETMAVESTLVPVSTTNSITGFPPDP